MSIDDIMNAVAALSVKRVTVTGGEPLAQPNVHALMSRLCDEDYAVSLETSGALTTEAVDKRVVKVVDLKTPGSKEMDKNLWDNVAYLTPKDQIKFVLCSREDYDWAKFKCDEHGLYEKVADVLFSPSFEQLSPTDLGDWIVADRIPVRMQVQLHKLLWGDEPGR